MKRPEPASVYRPNVAAILMNDAGRILVGERVNVPNSWQFPQGGLEVGETPEQGLAREMREELSLESADYEIGERRGLYRYLFAPGQTKKGYWGQEQTYFRLRLLGPESRVDAATEHPEFRALRWVEPAEYRLAWLPEMKREVYRQVFLDFFALKIT